MGFGDRGSSSSPSSSVTVVTVVVVIFVIVVVTRVACFLSVRLPQRYMWGPPYKMYWGLQIDITSSGGGGVLPISCTYRKGGGGGGGIYFMGVGCSVSQEERERFCEKCMIRCSTSYTYTRWSTSARPCNHVRKSGGSFIYLFGKKMLREWEWELGRGRNRNRNRNRQSDWLLFLRCGNFVALIDEKIACRCCTKHTYLKLFRKHVRGTHTRTPPFFLLLRDTVFQWARPPARPPFFFGGKSRDIEQRAVLLLL